MPEDTLDDKPVDSSPTDTSPEATGSAASQAPIDSPPPDKAVTGEQDSTVAVETDAPTAKSAIELLSGKKPEAKAAPKAEEKPKDPPKAAPKPDEKKPVDAENPLADYTDEEKKRISHKTRDRIETLHRSWKQTEAKVKELEPIAQEGKVWAQIMDQYKVRSDLADIRNDASVAEAIKFQAALHRIGEGRASQHDKQFVSAVYETLDETRQALGLPAKQAASPVDTAEIEAAVAKAKTEFDFSDLEKVLAKAKTSTQPQAPVQPIQQQPHQPQVEHPKGPTPEEIYYGKKVESELTESGITADKVRDYVGTTLWPQVVNSLAKTYPGFNPVEVYAQLPPQAQFDAVMQAHRIYQKQQEALKPKQTETPTTPRPVRTTGTQPRGGNTDPPVGNGLAAARWLAGA